MNLFHFPDGATPIDDYSDLIPSWIHTLQDLNRAEAENIYYAQKKYLNQTEDPLKWFTFSQLQQMHQIMFQNVWRWAGKIRKSMKSIGVEPYLISTYLADLCNEVIFWCKNPVELTFVEQAARIHHKLVFIHPFENGNGRFSRLVADRFLKFWRRSHSLWPYELQNEGKFRDEYIQTLQSADKGNLTPLIQLMKKLGATDPSLAELLISPFYKKNLTNKQRLFFIRALLRNGANIDETYQSHHPLHICIRGNLNEVALELIKQKIDTRFKDRSGYDSFELSISKQNFVLANAICNAGYPYNPQQIPSTKLMSHYDALHKFNMEFFNR